MQSKHIFPKDFSLFEMKEYIVQYFDSFPNILGIEGFSISHLAVKIAFRSKISSKQSLKDQIFLNVACEYE